MLLATALALLITGCAQQTFTVQNKPAAVAPKETITHRFFVSGIGRKTSMQPKFVAARENVVKTETQQTFVNGLLGFINFKRLSPLGACVLLTIIAWVAHRYANALSALINILLGFPFQLFLHSDQPLSEGEIIPFSGVCCQSGSCIIHAGGGGGFTHWRRANDVQPTTTSGNIITQASFSALASANSFVYFASSAAASRWRICMSVIAAFASFSSLAFFVALGFVGNGVIHGNGQQPMTGRRWCR